MSSSSRRLVRIAWILVGVTLSGACAGPRPLPDGWQGDGRGWFDAEIARGYDDDGHPVATLALSVPYRHMIFRRQDEGYAAHYRIRAIQRDGAVAVHSQEWGGELHVADYSTTKSAEVMRRTVRFSLASQSDADMQVEVSFAIEGTQRSASRVLAARAPAAGSHGIALAELGLYSLRNLAPPLPPMQEIGAGELPDATRFALAEQGTFDVTTGDPYLLIRLFDLSGARTDSIYNVEWASKARPESPMRIELRRRGVETAVLVPVPGSMLKYGSNEVVVRVGSDAQRSIVIENLGIDLEDDASWTSTLKQIDELATPQALERLRAAPVGERELAWLDFWSKLDPTPETPNERLAEHYRRVGHARRSFAEGKLDGVQTDRGRIYVLHGEPDRIEEVPPRWDDPSAWQLWHYDELGLSFYFRQTQGGEFRLAGSERV